MIQRRCDHLGRLPISDTTMFCLGQPSGPASRSITALLRSNAALLRSNAALIWSSTAPRRDATLLCFVKHRCVASCINAAMLRSYTVMLRSIAAPRREASLRCVTTGTVPRLDASQLCFKKDHATPVCHVKSVYKIRSADKILLTLIVISKFHPFFHLIN